MIMVVMRPNSRSMFLQISTRSVGKTTVTLQTRKRNLVCNFSKRVTEKLNRISTLEKIAKLVKECLIDHQQSLTEFYRFSLTWVWTSGSVVERLPVSVRLPVCGSGQHYHVESTVLLRLML